jgi:hypothetical protein
MRPKIAMWSDYGAPRHRHWRSLSRRSSWSSIGPTILVAAVVVVAAVIGISGIHPQIIDSEWAYGTSTHSQRVTHSEIAPTLRRSGIVAAVPLPPRRAPATTGEAAAPASTPTPAATPAPVRTAAAPAPAPASPPATAASEVPAPALVPRPAVSEMHPSVGATEQPAADPDTVLAAADIPEVQAIADPPAKPAPAVTHGVRPSQRYFAKAPVVKRRVVGTEHHRGYSGAYAQYGGSWGGWSGWLGLGSPYHF